MKVQDQDNQKVIRTVCMMHCGTSCGALAHIKNGVLTKVEPADYPEPEYRYICRRGLCSPKHVYSPDRLKYPLERIGERGDGKWQRISWDEALDTVASRFKTITEKYGPKSVAMMNGGLNFPSGGLWIDQRFASASGATWVDSAACMAAQHCGDTSSVGTNMAEPYYRDHEDPRLFVFWGANVVETFPWRYRRRIRPAMEKGAKLVAISPLFTSTAAKADEWIPIRPGTDAALALGMINVIVSEELCDEAFLTEYTVGPFLVQNDNGLFLREGQIPSGDSSSKYIVWDTRRSKPQPYDTPGVTPALRGSYRLDGIECKPAFQLLAELAEQYTLERTSEITEVAPDVIRRLALDYAALRPVVSERGLGLSRAFYGDLAYRAINALAAVTGNICLKKPNNFFAVLNWAPFIAPGGRIYTKMTSSQLYHNHLTGKPYPIKALWVSSHNPANSHANRNNFLEVMRNMEFIVVTDISMSSTAEYADILLPGCTPFECTSLALPYAMFFGGGVPYLQLQPKLIEPLYECRSDLDILNGLAQRMGLGEFFSKTEEEYIELLLSSNHPSMEGITLENLKKGPIKPKPYGPTLFTTPSDRKEAGQVVGSSTQVQSSGHFDTPSHRLEFYVEKLKEFGQELPVFIEPPESARQPLAQKYPLILLNVKSKGRHHAVGVNVDWLRELDPEPLVRMNSVDAEKRGIKDGDVVIAFNDRGRVRVKARIHEGVRPGAVCVSDGWPSKYYAEGSSPQVLTNTAINPAQEAVDGSGGQYQGVQVEVKKAEEE